MMETAKKLNGTIDDVVNMALKAYGMNMIKYMNEDDLVMFKTYFGIVDAYKEHIIKEADTLDEINKKLDKLLSKMES